MVFLTVCYLWYNNKMNFLGWKSSTRVSRHSQIECYKKVRLSKIKIYFDRFPTWGVGEWRRFHWIWDFHEFRSFLGKCVGFKRKMERNVLKTYLLLCFFFFTGSYYEKLRVSQPNEFDTMLVFDSHRITKFFNIEYNFRDPSTMLFAKLLFKDRVLKGRELWGAFLTADGKYLSPTKLLSHFISSVRKAVKLLARDKRHRVSNVRQNGPAVTLKIDEKIEFDLVLGIEILEWPRCASGWGNFSSKGSWPTKHQVEEIKISQPKCYLVAKPCDAKRSLDSRVFWRISFSEAEKKLLLPSDSDKKYFKIVKAIFQAKKEELKPLTSFHLKNAFLLHRCEKPDKSNLARSVLEFIQNLIQRMRKGLLPHFFVSRVNLLATISQDDRLKIARRLENYLVHLVKRPNCFLPSLNP